MPDLPDDHEPNQQPGHHVQDGHEHPAHWPQRPLLRARARAELDDLITYGHDESPQSGRARRELEQAVRAADELDAAIGEFRLTFLGAGGALERALEWLARSEPGSVPPVSPPPDAVEDPLRSGDGPLAAEQFLHPTGLLDLTVGAAFICPEETRAGVLAGIDDRITGIARTVAVTMSILEDLSPELSGRPRFDAFLEDLDDFDRFLNRPVDLAGCLGELVNVLSRPNGPTAA